MMPVHFKILVFDDNDDIREVVRMILELDGFIVEELNNGYEVEQTVIRLKPHLILLDVMLGDCDGRDVCKQLKSRPDTASVPIVIVSATHGPHTSSEKNCGADAYLSKPFDINQLSSLVKDRLFA